MKIVFAVLLLLALNPIGSFGGSEEFSFFSFFSNREVSGDDEIDYHCSGHELKLFQHNESLVGLFVVHGPQCGDPPTGTLEEVRYDPKSHEFKFESILSISYSRDGKRENSRAVFNGKLWKDKIIGTVSWYKLDDNSKPWKVNEIKIVNTTKTDHSYLTEEFKTYSDWKEYERRILGTR